MMEGMWHYLLMHFLPVILFTCLAYGANVLMDLTKEMKGLSGTVASVLASLAMVVLAYFSAVRVVPHDTNTVWVYVAAGIYCLTTVLLPRRLLILVLTNMFIALLFITLLKVN